MADEREFSKLDKPIVNTVDQGSITSKAEVLECIVGCNSAAGLEDFEQFFSQTSVDAGMSSGAIDTSSVDFISNPGDMPRKDIIDLKLNQKVEDLVLFPQENPYPVLRVQQDGILLYANHACSALDLAVCQPGQLIPEVYRKTVLEALDKGVPQYIELEGRELLFGLSFVPIAKAGYVNIYGIDITNQKKFNLMLKESEERFRVICETAPIGISVSSMDGLIIYVNPSFKDILGYEQNELVGRNASDELPMGEEGIKQVNIVDFLLGA